MTIRDKVIEVELNLDNSYTNLPKLFYTNTKPIPVPSPKLVILNHSLSASLGLSDYNLEKEEGIDVLAGNKIPKESTPIAQAYAGHQFGHFTMLGDGRAVLLGEIITSKGDRFDIALKGSGKTPYSRGGDGRATLGPMLREYIISEAMHGLGIPTTRSLAVTTTGKSIMRETRLPGAILTRIAASHVRVGTFQYASKYGAVEDLRSLADYTIKRHFSNSKDSSNPYLSLLKEVIKGQAILIAKWQLVGFIHGVMNTDNMTISGETIDYGPCAFMDNYDPDTVFSSIDIHGRYAYKNQPHIGEWNLTRFAETLLPLLHEDTDEAVKIAQNEILSFREIYQYNWLNGMRRKLGIFNEEIEDESLIEGLLSIMKKYDADYTNTLISLTFNKLDGISLFASPEFTKWYKQWESRLGRQEESKELSQQLMKNNNPALIPRNHRVEAALEAAVKEGDLSVMNKLLDALSNPYAHSPEQVEYRAIPEPSSCTYKTFCGT